MNCLKRDRHEVGLHFLVTVILARVVFDPSPRTRHAFDFFSRSSLQTISQSKLSLEVDESDASIGAGPDSSNPLCPWKASGSEQLK